MTPTADAPYLSFSERAYNLYADIYERFHLEGKTAAQEVVDRIFC
jgi:hypothetical protein